MLRTNDVGAYLKLVESAKSSRISELLGQTDAVLRQLASRLRASARRSAAQHSGGFAPLRRKAAAEAEAAGDASATESDAPPESAGAQLCRLVSAVKLSEM